MKLSPARKSAPLAASWVVAPDQMLVERPFSRLTPDRVKVLDLFRGDSSTSLPDANEESGESLSVSRRYPTGSFATRSAEQPPRELHDETPWRSRRQEKTRGTKPVSLTMLALLPVARITNSPCRSA